MALMEAFLLARNGPVAAGSPPTIAAVDDEVVTRELGFEVGLMRRGAFRREVQQVCVELGLGCEIDDQRRLLTARFRVLVRGSREGVDALIDYARVSGWETWTDDALDSAFG
jgi:hypothetical protein